MAGLERAGAQAMGTSPSQYGNGSACTDGQCMGPGGKHAIPAAAFTYS